MDEFTDETVLNAGEWDRRFARVLATATADGAAVALIDPNGADGPSGWAEIEFYAWEPAHGWSWTTSGSAGSSGWSTPGVIYACGQSSERNVTVSFGGERHDVRVGPAGWWLFATRGDPDEEAPTVVS